MIIWYEKVCKFVVQHSPPPKFFPQLFQLCYERQPTYGDRRGCYAGSKSTPSCVCQVLSVKDTCMVGIPDLYCQMGLALGSIMEMVGKHGRGFDGPSTAQTAILQLLQMVGCVDLSILKAYPTLFYHIVLGTNVMSLKTPAVQKCSQRLISVLCLCKEVFVAFWKDLDAGTRSQPLQGLNFILIPLLEDVSLY